MTAIDFTAFVDELAAISGETIRPFFRSALGIENKSRSGGFDPVTAADRAAEAAMRTLIKRTFPEHGIIGEEFGILGAVLIVGLFGVLIWRGLEVARRAPDQFSRYVATGITLLFMFQAFINIAAMLSLVPLTGIPLPFVSYGGSSLMVMLLATGVLLNISQQAD